MIKKHNNMTWTRDTWNVQRGTTTIKSDANPMNFCPSLWGMKEGPSFFKKNEIFVGYIYIVLHSIWVWLASFVNGMPYKPYISIIIPSLDDIPLDEDIYGTQNDSMPSILILAYWLYYKKTHKILLNIKYLIKVLG